MNNASSKKEISPADLPQPVITQPQLDEPKSFNPFSLFWGALLVELGALLLLQNYNLAEIDFGNVLRLWPLLIVAAGISMLSLKGKLGTALVSLLLIAILALISLSATGIINSQTATSDSNSTKINISKESNAVELMRVSIHTGAGKLTLDSSEFEDVLRATLASTHSKLQQSSTIKDDIQTISLETEGDPGWWRGEYKNDLTVLFNPTMPLDLELETGASSTKADLSKTMLRELTIDSGASDATIKLGNKSPLIKIRLDVGMSSIKFRVPKDSGLSLKVDSGMSNQDTAGLRDLGDGKFESENYESAAHKILIEGDMGMANLDIEYY